MLERGHPSTDPGLAELSVSGTRAMLGNGPWAVYTSENRKVALCGNSARRTSRTARRPVPGHGDTLAIVPDEDATPSEELATDDSRRAYAEEVEYALAASAHTRRVQAAARRRRRRHALLTGIAIVLAAVGLAVIGIALFGGGSETSSTAPPPTTATQPTTAPAHAIPDFVWVPVKRAARYRIEFTRDGRVVLQRTTTAPRLHLTGSTLPPGTYHWRVWALAASGARIGAPVVDASVAIR